MSGLQDRIDAAAGPPRASGASGIPDDAGFDLLANPFILLRVATDASAQTIKEAYEDAIEDARAPAEVLARAQQCLLSPKLRVDAEVGGLLGVDPRLASRVLAKLRSGAGRAMLTEEIHELDALPRSNLSAHLGARTPGFDAMLDLLHAQAAIAAGRVLEAIGAAREAAGAAKVDAATIELALSQLTEQQARAVVYASSGDATFTTAVATLVERTLAGQDAAAIDQLDLYLRVYGRASASELSRRRENVMAACEAQRREPASQRAAEQIIGALTRWAEIARPLQLYEAHRNRDDAASGEVYQQARNLYIWLCNQNHQFGIAQRLSQACLDLFKHVPGALTQTRQDFAALEWAGLNDELKQALATRKWDEATALIGQMLARGPDAENARRLRETREKIEANRSQRTKSYVGGIAVGLFLLIQAAMRFSSTNQPYNFPVAPYYQPPPPSALGPSLAPRPSTAPGPWPQLPGVPAPQQTYDNGAEEKPAIGTVTGTRGNLRYCAFQKVRIDVMRTVMLTPVDKAEHDRRVEDWRARCARVQGNPGDQSVINREVSAARFRLEAEGFAIASRWREDNAAGRTRDAAGH